MSTVINIWTAKGGQGGTLCTVAAAVAASKYACNVDSVGITGHDVDAIAATFGIGGTPKAGDALAFEGRRIQLADGSESVIINDRGPLDEGSSLEGGLLATRNCYLALRRAVRLGSGLSGVILIAEPKRALTTREVTSCLSNMPLIAMLETSDAVARMNDAGLVAQRTPDTLLNVGYAILRASGIATAPELIEA